MLVGEEWPEQRCDQGHTASPAARAVREDSAHEQRARAASRARNGGARCGWVNRAPMPGEIA
jgi:hypothetical protein